MKIRHWIVEAILGFVLWTLFLSPYMIFIVQTTTTQYFAWLSMQIILVTPIAPLVFRLTKMIKKKILGDVE